MATVERMAFTITQEKVMTESMQAASNATLLPFTQASVGVSPQGFDLGQLAQQVADQAIRALPGVILGLLSTHPAAGRAQGVTPQSLINIGVQTPFGGGGIKLFGADPGVSPQGIDLGNIGQQVLSEVVKALPGLIIGALAAHPVIGPQMRANGVSPQSLINIGVQTPFGGGGASLFNSAPGVSPQGFDLGQLAQQIAGQVLPTLIIGLLSANPAVNAGAANSGATH
jgi:hypothetical protein